MEEVVKNIDLKVKKLLEMYNLVIKENEKIVIENKFFQKKIINKENEIKEIKEKLKLLRITKNVGDHEENLNKESRKKINEYVREIDKCIALLNNQKYVIKNKD